MKGMLPSKYRLLFMPSRQGPLPHAKGIPSRIKEGQHMDKQQPVLVRLRAHWQKLSRRQFFRLKTPVALLALAGLVLVLLWFQPQLLTLLVGGLLFATWLWVWFFLHKRARPRALELELATLIAHQEQQQVQLDRLMTCLLLQQGSALSCLYCFAASDAFLLSHDASTRQAIKDIRYLYALGLIDQVAAHSLRTLLEALRGQTDKQDRIDIKDYSVPTEQGKHYLSLLQSSLAASLAAC
jgi:signal transduction histidine kinase